MASALLRSTCSGTIVAEAIFAERGDTVASTGELHTYRREVRDNVHRRVGEQRAVPTEQERNRAPAIKDRRVISREGFGPLPEMRIPRHGQNDGVAGALNRIDSGGAVAYQRGISPAGLSSQFHSRSPIPPISSDPSGFARPSRSDIKFRLLRYVRLDRVSLSSSSSSVAPSSSRRETTPNPPR